MHLSLNRHLTQTHALLSRLTAALGSDSAFAARPRILATLLLAFCLGPCLSGTAAAQTGAAQSACPNRGLLDSQYCDADGDLVADMPATPVSPERIVLGITSTEDALTARKTYSDLVNSLSTCLKKEVVLYPPTREGDVMEGLRTGQVHIAQFATGATMFAVNHAGAVPFAGKGDARNGRADGYNLLLIVRADSPYKVPTDLKGKRMAHTTLTSNSGNLAPRALFPELGLVPDTDYKVEYSGKHDNSIQGVLLGLYDGAAVASDVLTRLVDKGDVKREALRVIYTSEDFPPDAFSMAFNLEPKLAQQIRTCFFDYKWPSAMVKNLEGNNRFVPINYKKDWQIIRVIAKASGTPLGKEAYLKFVSGKK